MDATVIDSSQRPRDETPRRNWWLGSLIGIQAVLYGSVSLLSRRFDPHYDIGDIDNALNQTE